MTDTIGARLKSERERLGLSQSAFGKLGGVGKTTVIAWERGTAYPNAAFMQAAATAGVDVHFVVTGLVADAKARLDVLGASMTAAAAKLTDYHDVRELGLKLSALIERYLDCDQSDQVRIEQLAELLAIKKDAGK